MSDMVNQRSVTASAPATVANVGCGFDIMGFALKGKGDRITVAIRENDDDDCLSISGYGGSEIPCERQKNTAGVAIDAYLKATGNTSVKLDIKLEKNLPPGSGMGSSASSAAAGVFAVNKLLGEPLNITDLIPFAMEGEKVACGAAHADNVAPSLLGGFILIRSHEPLDLIRIKCPDRLYCAVVHPDIRINTSDARRILNLDIPMYDATRQSANTAAFVTGLLKGDLGLIGRSMNDLLAEPKRTMLIPGFEEVRKRALEAGAIGCGISGSGPSVFALADGFQNAVRLSEIMKESFMETGLPSETYISSLNEAGALIE
jgi:homoserine kinase